MSNAPMSLSSEDIEEAVAKLTWGERLTFANKSNRDAVFHAAKRAGLKDLGRSSIRNQLMDPRYTFEGRNKPDMGLANDYRHHFSALYDITTSRRWR